MRRAILTFLILTSAALVAGEAKPPVANTAATDAIADKIPDKKLEDSKIYLTTFLAKAVIKSQRAGLPGAAPKKVLLIGPGVANGKERFVPKSTESRAYVAGPATVTGNVLNASLMQALPEVLAKERPGYVLIVGAKGRKVRSELEVTDWFDICQMCLKYGAVPILGLPDTPEPEDPMRVLFAKTAGSTNVPAIDLNAPGSPELLPLLLRLLDQYVLQLPELNAGPAVKKPEVEE